MFLGDEGTSLQQVAIFPWISWQFWNSFAFLKWLLPITKCTQELQIFIVCVNHNEEQHGGMNITGSTKISNFQSQCNKC
jgi:hypothetical protein